MIEILFFFLLGAAAAVLYSRIRRLELDLHYRDQAAEDAEENARRLRDEITDSRGPTDLSESPDSKEGT